jgi:hypothetical protein
MTISLTAVQHWLHNDALKKQVTQEVLAGKKKMCLAVTEAFAGSDVAGIRTTAELSEDGSHYIVNGTKKWYVESVPVILDRDMLKRNQDHQRHVQRLLRHRLQIEARLPCPARPPHRRR